MMDGGRRRKKGKEKKRGKMVETGVGEDGSWNVKGRNIKATNSEM